jgi:hypothetical protein
MKAGTVLAIFLALSGDGYRMAAGCVSEAFSGIWVGASRAYHKVASIDNEYQVSHMMYLPIPVPPSLSHTKIVNGIPS